IAFAFLVSSGLSSPAICEESPLLPDTPTATQQLLAKPPAPGQISSSMEELELAPRLLNFYVATISDLSKTGLVASPVVYIPVQITEEKGGRDSIYYLDETERELVGIFVGAEKGILLNYITKLRGTAKPAKVGDEYKFELVRLDGHVLFEDRGRIVLIDYETGRGVVRYDSGIEANSLIWSLITKTQAR
ncbi:MAG: hypothetical protein MN733_42870, partial [Nitrososphaera sp.]|nr:hypothetical protein [Nitrososphaera sp.]